MKFTLRSAKNDPVKTFVSDDGFYKIIKRPTSKYILMSVNLFNIMGTEIGEFDTFEEAAESV